MEHARALRCARSGVPAKAALGALVLRTLLDDRKLVARWWLDATSDVVELVGAVGGRRELATCELAAFRMVFLAILGRTHVF